MGTYYGTDFFCKYCQSALSICLKVCQVAILATWQHPIFVFTIGYRTYQKMSFTCERTTLVLIFSKAAKVHCQFVAKSARLQYWPLNNIVFNAIPFSNMKS